MTTWFTSDEHFGHRNIIAYSDRPFADVEEMTREIVTRHNAVVGDDDTVWHLGDFALDERLVPQVLPLLRGRHRLVSGNHDRCHPCHKKHNGAVRRYLLYGFETVSTRIEMGPWVFCHLPYAAEGEAGREGRYPEHSPVDEGKWLLHGHVHELWKTRRRMINVGVDQWNYTPVSLDALDALRVSVTGGDSSEG